MSAYGSKADAHASLLDSLVVSDCFCQRGIDEPNGILLHTRQYVGIGVERVELLDKTFTRKRGFTIEKYAENSFGVFQEDPVDVVWKFSPKAARDASEFLFHPGQTLEPQKDGSLLVRFRAGGLLEMSWHLFTWGDEVEIIKPKRLRSMLQKQLETCSAGTAKTMGKGCS